MKGDYLLGTRDVTITAAASWGIFNDGIPDWLEQMTKQPLCITLRPERQIEEAPTAYKSIERVIDTQVAAGMVVAAKMRPILTFKA